MKIRIFFLVVSFILVISAFTEVSAQTRVRFARGRTSATLSGTVGGSATRRFVLGASNGQTLSANVSSRNDCVKFEDGATSTSFVTSTGDNWLVIKNRCGRSTTFSLTVSINYSGE